MGRSIPRLEILMAAGAFRTTSLLMLALCAMTSGTAYASPHSPEGSPAAQPAPFGFSPSLEERALVRSAATSLGLHLTEAELDDVTLQLMSSSATNDQRRTRTDSLVAAAADPCSAAGAFERACKAIFDAAKKAGAVLRDCGSALVEFFARRKASALGKVVRNCGGPGVVAVALEKAGLTLNSLCKRVTPNPLGIGDFLCDQLF